MGGGFAERCMGNEGHYILTYQVCRSQNTLTALKLNAEALKYRRSVGGPQFESLYVQVRIDWRSVGESIEAA